MKALLLIIITTTILQAEIKRSPSSFLKNDPKVVYVEDLTNEKLVFEVIETRPVFYTKKGHTKSGAVTKGIQCELIAFDDRAYKVKYKGRNGNISGWVSPHALSCSDDKFIENFKKLYKREIEIKALIAKNEIAIGMTPEEVIRSLGEPTKTKLRVTAKGSSGHYEYIETYEQKHYAYFQDPESGQTFRNHTHTTTEVKNSLKVEFTDHAVSAIEESEDNSVNARPAIVTTPIYLDLGQFILF